ncbi:hypothetical protein [Nonomuraea sp. NPDC002799]
MPVPHDPIHHARRTFRWRDEHWYLLDEPVPAVVFISDNVSQSDRHPSPDVAETAFWVRVVDGILAERDRVASAAWPGVEIVAVLDKVNCRALVAERTRRNGCQVWVLSDRDAALAAFRERVCALIKKCEKAA